MSFRYDLDSSDSKGDMLLPQIDPAFTRKRTSELNLSADELQRARRESL